ncbi:MAG: hypothetical protein ACI9FB_000282 [Candidatus Azotimanducaceae bacterium]|jgi:hypothetical protein
MYFDIIIEHMGSTLEDLGVPGSKITEATNIAKSTRNDSLNK